MIQKWKQGCVAIIIFGYTMWGSCDAHTQMWFVHSDVMHTFICDSYIQMWFTHSYVMHAFKCDAHTPKSENKAVLQSSFLATPCGALVMHTLKCDSYIHMWFTHSYVIRTFKCDLRIHMWCTHSNVMHTLICDSYIQMWFTHSYVMHTFKCDAHTCGALVVHTFICDSYIQMWFTHSYVMHTLPNLKTRLCCNHHFWLHHVGLLWCTHSYVIRTFKCDLHIHMWCTHSNVMHTLPNLNHTMWGSSCLPLWLFLSLSFIARKGFLANSTKSFLARGFLCTSVFRGNIGLLLSVLFFCRALLQ